MVANYNQTNFSLLFETYCNLGKQKGSNYLIYAQR